MPAAFNDERFRMLLRSSPEEALNQLYKTYYKDLLGVALHLTNDINVARDIVHDTFIVVHAKRNELSSIHEKNIEHFLKKVIRFKCITHYRKKRNHFDIEDLLFLKTYSGDNDLTDDAFIKQETRDAMRKEILTYTIREQQCMFMKIDRELLIDEIAFELKISRKMVEKSQTSALRKLERWALGQK